MSKFKAVLLLYFLFLGLYSSKGNFMKSTKFNVLAQFVDRKVVTSSPISCAGICQASTKCAYYHFLRDNITCPMGAMVDFKAIDWSRTMAQPAPNSSGIRFHTSRSTPTKGTLKLPNSLMVNVKNDHNRSEGMPTIFPLGQKHHCLHCDQE